MCLRVEKYSQKAADKGVGILQTAICKLQIFGFELSALRPWLSVRTTTLRPMLRLQHISAFQFKNHFSAQQAFTKKVVGICGANGAGKTNLLDAIYYLCFTKSYFAGSDAALVHHGQAGFRVAGKFAIGSSAAQVVCVLRETGKKEISWNEEPYSKVSAHVGRLPAVIIAPDDVELINRW